MPDRGQMAGELARSDQADGDCTIEPMIGYAHDELYD